MSVYSELLKLAVAQSRDAGATVDELVARAVAIRPPDETGATTADGIAGWLAYDVILVRLCDLLDVPHRMLDPDAGPASRVEAETRVARKVPTFRSALNTA